MLRANAIPSDVAVPVSGISLFRNLFVPIRSNNTYLSAETLVIRSDRYIIPRGARLGHSMSACSAPTEELQMLHRKYFTTAAILSMALTAISPAAKAEDGCKNLPSQSDLKAALVAATAAETSGLNNHMWG